MKRTLLVIALALSLGGCAYLGTWFGGTAPAGQARTVAQGEVLYTGVATATLVYLKCGEPQQLPCPNGAPHADAHVAATIKSMDAAVYAALVVARTEAQSGQDVTTGLAIFNTALAGYSAYAASAGVKP